MWFLADRWVVAGLAGQLEELHLWTLRPGLLCLELLHLELPYRELPHPGLLLLRRPDEPLPSHLCLALHMLVRSLEDLEQEDLEGPEVLPR